jgi:hypothetical protein
MGVMLSPDHWYELLAVSRTGRLAI